MFIHAKGLQIAMGFGRDMAAEGCRSAVPVAGITFKGIEAI